MNLVAEENVKFRLATSIDLPIIIDIFSSVIGKTYELESKIINEFITNLKTFFNNQNEFGNYWIAYDSTTNHPVGWHSFFPIFYSPIKKNTCVEGCTYIHPDFQNSGIAFNLINFALNEIRNTQIRYIYGFVDKYNTNAIMLMNKLGFIEVGVIPEYPSVFPFYYENILFVYFIK